MLYLFYDTQRIIPMELNLLDIVKLGRKYISLWPERIELAQYFKDYRTVQVARFTCKYLPAMALFVFVMQLYFGGYELLPQALVYGLFILSMPVQALVVSGVKADKFLPPDLAAWYKEGVAKFNQGGGNIKLSVSKPRYIDLAQLLNITYRSMPIK
ncbi:terminus macrodomain insulation protein YfbV [Colwellia sp. UCD-KL20]|uniref:terminus macrodomain insulation protein YfbV n=1 Tax=Colwellia sp. UCD-KL20 TaxID=1917165 RepID=UPI0025709AB4|nr:terminus macrodomain insulation protein YfbV [Colwellia sp. UCD-KL20]